MPTQTKSPSTTARRAEILNDLLDRHRRELRRQAFRHAPRPSDAEDALQEACAQFMHGYAGPPGVDALRWLNIVLKRCAWGIRDRERHQRACASLDRLSANGDRDPGYSLDADHGDPLLTVERAERCAADLAAINRLKPDERTALMLLGLGYSYSEIGEMQGWTHTKVNRCIAEGRETLRAARRKDSAAV